MRANYAALSLFQALRAPGLEGSKSRPGMNEEGKRPERGDGSLHLRKRRE